MQDQHLQDYLVDLDLVHSLVNQFLGFSVFSAPLPMDQQDFPLVDSQDILDSHHPALAPVAELAASALPTWVDLPVRNSALDTLVDSPFSGRDMDRQAVSPDLVLDSETRASVSAADSVLLPLGLE